MKVLPFTIPVADKHTVVVQEDVLPYFYPHLHRHKETQITWIIKGEGTLLIDDFIGRFEAGDIYVIGSNQPHIFKSDTCFLENEQANAVHSVTLFFNATSLFGNLMKLPEMTTINKFIGTSARGLKIPPQYFDTVSVGILAVKNQENALRVAAFLQLLALLASLKEPKMLTSVSTSHNISDIEGLRMDSIYQYTMAHFTSDISLDTIAEIACMTPQSFCRYFKKHTRKTFITFLNDIRITEACQKIINGKNLSMGAIAYESGFNNVVTFNRLFKKSMGCSPSEYLKTYNK